MNYTRVDTDELRAVTERAERSLKDVLSRLAPFLVLLNEDDRRAILRTPTAFPEGGRQFARAMAAHPELATVVNYDPEAVTEDLDNVATLQSLLTELGELKRRIDDTILLWSAEAYQQSWWSPSRASTRVGGARGRRRIRAGAEPRGSAHGGGPNRGFHTSFKASALPRALPHAVLGFTENLRTRGSCPRDAQRLAVVPRVHAENSGVRRRSRFVGSPAHPGQP